MKTTSLLSLIVLMFIVTDLHSQMYILNEDFSTANDTTPPLEWSNITILGGPDDLWHFDNQGGQDIGFPIVSPFAIFDAGFYSNNGQNEQVALETPSFDASISNYILLEFDHTFFSGDSGVCTIQAYNGTDWFDVISYSDTISDITHAVVDISTYVGGITNARLRFLWIGKGSGYWAFDNVSIFAASPVDAGITSIDNPVTPVTQGVHDVDVTITNYGSQSLTSATIKWSADGVMQPDYYWVGDIPLGNNQSDINIGTYDFQDAVLLKIWSENPNGQGDPNPYNDTVSVMIYPILCGTYTIGGNNPDFSNFTEAVAALHAAGISCPVVFKVRDGAYEEQIEIDDILGSSTVNTITFESESGDSSSVVITSNYDISSQPYTIFLDGSKHVRFNKISIGKTGTYWTYYAMQISGNSSDIQISNCKISTGAATGIFITGQADSVVIKNSYLTGSGSCIYNGNIDGIRLSTTGCVKIIDNTITSFQTSGISGSANKLFIERNNLNQLSIYVRDFGPAIYCSVTDTCSICNNFISRTVDGIVGKGNGKYLINGNIINFGAGIGISANIHNSVISNNWVYNNFNNEATTNAGISLTSCSNTTIVFNSINLIRSNKNSRSFLVNSGNNLTVKNNIFSIKQDGFPVYIMDLPTNFECDYNDYYSPYNKIGWFNGLPYTELNIWGTAIGGEGNGIFSNPFFINDSISTPNQILINNVGVPIEGIIYDIDSTLRNQTNPDIGAKEFSPCTLDAGINFVTAPTTPITPGPEEVKVILQNQGTIGLNTVDIYWSVNGVLQAPFSWVGSLASSQNTEVTLDTYTFQSAVEYLIKAWTSNPNNGDDCNVYNDTTTSVKLYAKLCGTYTIGGTNPDFQTFSQAVEFLNRAGITCPVVFKVRDGTYEEQVEIYDIFGSSSVNTITFESESGDSNSVFITSNYDISSQPHTIRLDGPKHVRFNKISIGKTGTYWTYYAMQVCGNSSDIQISNCKVIASAANGISITGQADSVVIKNSYLTGSVFLPPGFGVSGILLSTTGCVKIIDNTITSFQTSGISGSANKLFIERNNLNQLSIYVRDFGPAIYCSVTDTCSICNNFISRTVDGIVGKGNGKYLINGNIINFGAGIGISANIHNSVISNNWVYNNFNNEATTNAGISLTSCSNTTIVFNSINLIRSNKNSRSFLVNSGNNLTVKNNIFSIKQDGFPVYIMDLPTNFECDYNDYYSPYNKIGWFNGLPYTELNIWGTAIGGEGNGIFSNPFFINDSISTPNQILINNVGVPIEGIIYDIDSTLRDQTNPDIGAKEFSPCTLDAGINFVTAPTTPITPGPEEVKVILQNQGTIGLNTVDIYWSVNGVLQAPFSWVGSLASSQNTEVTLDTYTFQSAVEYLIKAWTSNPNNGDDCNVYNDTTTSVKLYAKLCGTYTIGGTNPDFQTFSQAVEFLNRAGITCPVVFKVRDGTYEEQVEIYDIFGSSSVNTITFESESGDSNSVFITSNYDISSQPHTIRLDGPKHVRFNKISIGKTGTYWTYYAMQVCGNSSDIQISNCKVIASAANGISITGQADSVVIKNSYLTGSVFLPPGFGVSGILLSTTGCVKIIDNNVNSFRTSGIKGSARKLFIEGNKLNIFTDGPAIHCNVTDSCSITSNIITNTINGIICNGQGIYKINGNIIDIGIGTGISANIQNSLIYNNWILNNETITNAGISLTSCINTKLFFNSISIKGINNSSNSLLISGGQNINLKSNIFSNVAGGYCINVTESTTNLICDYNNYYSVNDKVGYINGNSYSTLSSWASAIGGEANGRNLYPYFANDSSYKVYQRGLNGAGIPVPGILLDIEGKIRNDMAPDIGAWEFLVDFGVTDLISPSLDCFHTEIDSVKVYLRQFGDIPFIDLKLAYQVNNGTIHYDTVPGTIYNDLIFTFSTTVNMSADGEYHFKVWLIDAVDDNINNDTLYTVRYSKPSPVVTASYNNQCTWNEVFFTGSAQIIEPYFIESYEWSFGDSIVSVEQNPVHIYENPGLYDAIFRAYSNAGCYSDDTLDVFIDPAYQVLEVNSVITNELCLGDGTGVIDIQASGGIPPYTYFMDGEPLDSNHVSDLPSGDYTITVKDTQQCESSEIATISSEIFMNPIISADPASGFAPLTVNFDFTSTGATSWIWDFGDGQTDTTQQPTHTFYDYGEHSVILAVNAGEPYFCQETDTIIIVLSFLSGQTINIPQGWSGISSFVSLVDDTITNLFSPIIDDLTLLMDGSTGMYWPDQGVNSLVYWDTFQGYKIHVTNDTELLFYGSLETNTSLNLTSGWSIIPVLTPNNFPAADIYTQLGDTLTLIKEVAGVKLFWPDQGVTSLESLIPGAAYQIHVSDDCSLSFTDWVCGDSLLDQRDGQKYGTVQIGTQCWLSQNINIGTRINGTSNQADNAIIEKYCQDNDEDNCDVYGGLYQWDEAMQYVVSPSVQGICPNGWHIQTDEEWKILEGTVDSQYGVGDPVWDNTGYRGFDAGNHLKSTTGWVNNGNGDDSFGFTALPGGRRGNDGGFYYLGHIGHFWSSSVYSSSRAWERYLNHYLDPVHRQFLYRTDGTSVRCLKDD